VAFAIADQSFKTVAGQGGKALSAVADSRWSSFRRPWRSIPENALTRFPAAKPLVRLSRQPDDRQ
jgi:hypothetical protein